MTSIQVAVVGSGRRLPSWRARRWKSAGCWPSEGACSCAAVSGASGGIRAGCQGSRRHHDRRAARRVPRGGEPWIDHAVATGIGHARNLAVVASGDAVIAVGGEWGTASEVAFARKLGRPVVLLGRGRRSTGRGSTGQRPLPRPWSLRCRSSAPERTVDLHEPASSMRRSRVSAPALSSGSLRLPHFGD